MFEGNRVIHRFDAKRTSSRKGQICAYLSRLHQRSNHTLLSRYHLLIVFRTTNELRLCHRVGDSTTHFEGYGDGSSDVFLATLSGANGYRVVTSSAVQTVSVSNHTGGYAFQSCVIVDTTSRTFLQIAASQLNFANCRCKDINDRRYISSLSSPAMKDTQPSLTLYIHSAEPRHFSHDKDEYRGRSQGFPIQRWLICSSET